MKNLVYVLIVLVFSSCSDSFTQSASVGLDNSSIIYINSDVNYTTNDIATQNNENTDKSIYDALCKVCHGLKGEGNDLAGKFFKMKHLLKVEPH